MKKAPADAFFPIKQIKEDSMTLGASYLCQLVGIDKRIGAPFSANADVLMLSLG